MAAFSYPGGSLLDKDSNGLPLGLLWHFFINMSNKISSKPWAATLKAIGTANLLFIFLIATPLHDLGKISIVLTLAGLFIITVFILKTKLHVIKWCCIIDLLTYYSFFLFFGLGNMPMASTPISGTGAVDTLMAR